MRTSRLRRSLQSFFTGAMVPAGLVIASVFAGCSASTDKHSIRSTMHRPATVQILDTYNDKVLWSKDVPPGQTINFDFNDPGATIELMQNSNQWPTQMTWSITGPGENDSGTVDLPGTPIMHRTTYATSKTIQGPKTMPAEGKPGAPPESNNQPPSG